MTILFFGDVVGRPGREAIRKILPELRSRHNPDLVIANAENLAHGKGVTMHTINSLFDAGVDFATSGNHVYDKVNEAKEVFEKLEEKIIRPVNLPDDLPGKGYQLLLIKNQPVLIANLNGQVFMEKQFDFGPISNPFEKLNQILASRDAENAKIKILDFHAEATSEKKAMGFWADGRVSAVLGTHTHIATADAQILPQGTGYQTDVGMVGAALSVIGVKRQGALKRFLAAPGEPADIPLEVAEDEMAEIGYTVLQIDERTGKCENINSFLELSR